MDNDKNEENVKIKGSKRQKIDDDSEIENDRLSSETNFATKPEKETENVDNYSADKIESVNKVLHEDESHETENENKNNDSEYDEHKEKMLQNRIDESKAINHELHDSIERFEDPKEHNYDLEFEKTENNDEGEEKNESLDKVSKEEKNEENENENSDNRHEEIEEVKNYEEDQRIEDQEQSRDEEEEVSDHNDEEQKTDKKVEYNYDLDFDKADDFDEDNEKEETFNQLPKQQNEEMETENLISDNEKTEERIQIKTGFDEDVGINRSQTELHELTKNSNEYIDNHELKNESSEEHKHVEMSNGINTEEKYLEREDGDVKNLENEVFRNLDHEIKMANREPDASADNNTNKLVIHGAESEKSQKRNDLNNSKINIEPVNTEQVKHYFLKLAE